MDAGTATHRSVSALVVGKDLLLDLIEATRGPFDSLDTLLLVAIVQANIAPVMSNPKLEASYAGLDQTPPDELRRPVSIAALAGATGLPFETVRRRVGRLRDAGVCLVRAEGVITPQRSLDTPEHREAIAANYRVLRDIFYRLEAIGLFEGQEWPPTTWTAGDPLPMRAATRYSADYALRMIDWLRQLTGDVVNGLIVLQLSRENLQVLGDGRERFASSDQPGFVPDHLKIPAGATRLAQVMRMDRETVRRRLAALAAGGHCERRGSGYIVPLTRLTTPGVSAIMAANDANLRRLYRNLARIGAVAAWRAEDLG